MIETLVDEQRDNQRLPSRVFKRNRGIRSGNAGSTNRRENHECTPGIHFKRRVPLKEFYLIRCAAHKPPIHHKGIALLGNLTFWGRGKPPLGARLSFDIDSLSLLRAGIEHRRGPLGANMCSVNLPKSEFMIVKEFH